MVKELIDDYLSMHLSMVGLSPIDIQLVLDKDLHDAFMVECKDFISGIDDLIIDITGYKGISIKVGADNGWGIDIERNER